MKNMILKAKVKKKNHQNQKTNYIINKPVSLIEASFLITITYQNKKNCNLYNYNSYILVFLLIVNYLNSGLNIILIASSLPLVNLSKDS